MATRSAVSLHFDDGSQFSAFTSWTLRETFSDPIGEMGLTVRPPFDKFAEYRERLQKGTLVGCQVDGKPQAAMMIETTRTRVGPTGSREIEVTACTPLKQMMTAGIDPKLSKSLATDAPLIELIAEVVEPFGIGEVVATEDIATIKVKTGKATGARAKDNSGLKYAEAQAQPNESAYAFLARQLTRWGVMLRMDAVLGTIYVTGPHYEGDPIYTVVQAAQGSTAPAGDRFVGDVEEVDSNDGQFSWCEATGAAPDKAGEVRASTPRARTDSSAICTPAPYRSAAALAYKPRFLLDKNCRDAERAATVSKLALGLVAERAYNVRGKVRGLVSRDGIPWTVDTLGRVYVESLGLDRTMWLAERTMHQDANEAQWTELIWTPPGAFTLGELSS